jgi:hypothetical protein
MLPLEAPPAAVLALLAVAVALSQTSTAGHVHMVQRPCLQALLEGWPGAKCL